MLEAARKGKLRLKRKELVEDEITSTFFGPFADMKTEEVWRIIKQMALTASIRENLFPNESPNDFSICLWPEHENIEPDIVLNFHFSKNISCNFLVEVKWGAPLIPRCELVRQWLSRPNPSEEWFHLYLLPSLSSGIADCDESFSILQNGCEDRDPKCCSLDQPKCRRPGQPLKETKLWKERLGSISWHQFQEISKRISGPGAASSLKRWGEGVNRFLERFGYIPFVGFGWLEGKPYSVLDRNDEIEFFYKKEWFSFIKEDYLAILDTPENLEYFKERRCRKQ